LLYRSALVLEFQTLGKEASVRTTIFAMAALLLAASVGCNKTETAQAPGGGVAVIDLDEVARRLGRDLTMTESLKAREGSLTQQLSTVQANYTKQLTDKKDAFGAELTEDQTRALLQMQQQANLQLNQVKQKAVANLTQHKTQLIAQFRDEVKPIAQAAAKARGYSVVATKNDAVVFTYDSAHDITDDVVAEMSKAGYKAPAPVLAAPAAETAAQPSAETRR